MRPGLLIALAMAGSLSAGSWVMLSPGDGYVIDWAGGGTRRSVGNPKVTRQGLSPADRWFQVAKDGTATAVWSAATGLQLIDEKGKTLLRRTDANGTFRFSTDGRTLAFATAKGIEVTDRDGSPPRTLAALAGVDGLQWASSGWVARAGSKLILIDEMGKQRTLAAAERGTPFAARGDRLVYYRDQKINAIDLATARTAPTPIPVRGTISDIELAPDGTSMLFTNGKRVYLSERNGPPREVAASESISDIQFASDGSTFLWVGATGGAIVRNGAAPIPLPAGTRSARFSERKDTEAVVTTEEGVWRWDFVSGSKVIAGGISSNDGSNLAGGITSDGAVTLYFKFDARMKANRPPI